MPVDLIAFRADQPPTERKICHTDAAKAAQGAGIDDMKGKIFVGEVEKAP
jgi:hypothetical protein